MNKNFVNSVTSSAFHLTLSKKMIAHLMGIYYKDNRSPDAHFIASKRALSERGMIIFHSAEYYHNQFPELKVEMQSFGAKFYKDIRTGYTTGARPIYTLTKEGILVAQLCESAGFNIAWYESQIDPRWATEPENGLYMANVHGENV